MWSYDRIRIALNISLNTFILCFYTPAIQASSKENNLDEERNLDVYFGRFIDVHAETSKLALILDVTWTSIFGPSLGKYVFLPFTIHVADHKNNTTIFNTVS